MKTLQISMIFQACVLLLLFGSCGPSVRLTASWSDNRVAPAHFSKVLVMSIGKDLSKRKMAEESIRRELEANGISAVAGLDEFSPEFANTDSAEMRRMLLGRQFDGVLTVRVLKVDESERWVPGGYYYAPIGFYRGFYGYYHRVWGYYASPGYTVKDVEVLLESNLYKVETGELLWSGQSKAFSRNPTPAGTGQYAKNIVNDLLRKKVIAQ